ncbi:hypothetical protein ACOMHN_042001 [Nucella lapillus]
MARRRLKLLGLSLLLMLMAFAVLRALSPHLPLLLHQHARARGDTRTDTLEEEGGEEDARDTRFFKTSAQQDGIVQQTTAINQHVGSNLLIHDDAKNSRSSATLWAAFGGTPRRTKLPSEDFVFLSKDSFQTTGVGSKDSRRLAEPTFPRELTRSPLDWSTFAVGQRGVQHRSMFPNDRRKVLVDSLLPSNVLKVNLDSSVISDGHSTITEDLTDQTPGAVGHNERQQQQQQQQQQEPGVVRDVSDHPPGKHGVPPVNHPAPGTRLTLPDISGSVTPWSTNRETVPGSAALTQNYGDVPEKGSQQEVLSRQSSLSSNQYFKLSPPPPPPPPLPPASDDSDHQQQQGGGGGGGDGGGRGRVVVVGGSELQLPLPHSPRYLVYLCEGEEEGEGERCGGWADRQRGLLSVSLLAHVTDRIFKVDMRTPCNLTNFLQPKGGSRDWWKGEMEMERGKGRGEEGGWLWGGGGVAVINDMRRPVLPGILQRRTEFNVQFPQGVVYVQTNRDLAPLLAHSSRYRPLLPEWSRHDSQATRFRLGWPLLVTPTPAITRKLSTLLRPLTRNGSDSDRPTDNGMPKRNALPSPSKDHDGSPHGMRLVSDDDDALSLGHAHRSGAPMNRLTNSVPDVQTDVNRHAHDQLITNSAGILKANSEARGDNPAKTAQSGITGHTANVVTTLGLNDATHTRHPLVCAHLRMGRNPDLPEDTGVWNDATSVQTTFTFLQDLLYTQKGGFVFVATDDQGVRVAARNRFQTRLLDHGGTIVHVDRQRELIHACAGFETAILDQLVLSQCDVLVMSRSGFSRHAAYLRHQQQHGLFLLNEGVIEPYRFT